MPKRLFLKALIGLSTLLLVTQQLKSEDFSWSEYKKTLPSSIIEGNDKTKTERTKENISKRYDVDVDRRTLSEIKREQRSKNLTVSAIFRNTSEYLETESYFDGITYTDPIYSRTSNFGISITGRFDLMAIGKKYNNTYATIDVFEDNIWMGIGRRIQAENRMGLFSDVGAGLFFQTQDTTRKSDMYFYGYTKIGYNFENWNIKAGINIPSDAFDSGFINTSIINVSIGWRF